MTDFMTVLFSSYYINQVEEMRSGDPDKESHVILAQCLDDQDWMELVRNKLDHSMLLAVLTLLSFFLADVQGNGRNLVSL